MFVPWLLLHPSWGQLPWPVDSPPHPSNAGNNNAADNNTDEDAADNHADDNADVNTDNNNVMQTTDDDTDAMQHR